jgi:hypothetical protein
VVPACSGLVASSPVGPVQMPGDPGADGVERQVVGERREQVE